MQLMSPVTPNQVVATIQRHRDELRQRGIVGVYLFGSVGRDEARPDSDVDLLVEFDHSVGLFELGATRVYFEQMLGRAVDLGTPSMLRPGVREAAMQEAVRAA